MRVPLPFAHLPLEDQDTLTLLTMCVWGEARNQPHAGKVAVACVVRNRVIQSPRFGDGWKGVLLKPKQFSCFNPGDPNAKKVLEPDQYSTLGIWNECAEAAYGVFKGEVPDNTAGACWYFTVKKPKGARVWPPKWSHELAKRCVIGDHVFYGEP